jgi:FtsP/CotA-like multicopper oxidase with cupredoxin domain
MPLDYRAAGDTQLAGAFVVDPVGAPANADRILVITDWTSLTKQQLKELVTQDDPGAEFMRMKPRFTTLMNGLSWPATERLTYRLGERVRWRVLNLSTQLHPMHLHGFYFDVDSMGDGWKDARFAEGTKPHVVTHLLMPGATMAMTWTPERVGNWLFHCHRMLHVAPERRLAADGESHEGHHAAHDSSAGMAGMVMGITVTGSESPDDHGACETAPRKLTLEMRAEPNRLGDRPAYGFVLSEASAATAASERHDLSAPGPTLVLQRDEPVEITLVNRLSEGTAVHWHGIELDSYYDGVHGWSGAGRRVTPLIEPGATFVVKFTPPRAGTFIYHTHLHDHQLASGLYGAIVVVAPGEIFDPETDHVVVMGRRGPAEDAPAVLNGELAPGFSWTAGVRHRIRFINITPDDVFVVSMGTGESLVNWRPVTKDGSPLRPDQSEPEPARQIIAVGETYDFVYEAPPGRRNLWMDVRSPSGRWMVQGRVSLK